MKTKWTPMRHRQWAFVGSPVVFRPTRTALHCLQALQDGTLVTTDSRGLAQVFNVEHAQNGK